MLIVTSLGLKKTKAKELNDILSKHFGTSSTAIQTPSILNHIKQEIMFFEATPNCPKALKEFKNCQDAFPPSSVEAKRCFSAAGLFIAS